MSQLISEKILGKELNKLSGIWQIRLLDDVGLDRFARERGLTSLFIGEHVRLLWNVGWLLADQIESKHPLEIDGLVRISDSEEPYIYADERVIDIRPDGWAGTVKKEIELDENVRLRFHPFRYYVLYHLERILKINITPIQMLFPLQSFTRLLNIEVESFGRISSKVEFAQSLARWNSTAAIAIYTEPCFHEILFGLLHISLGDSVGSQHEQLNQHLDNNVKKLFSQLGLEYLEKIRRDLCIAAEMLDPNKDVHTLLRLTQGERRLKHIKGDLGGSLCLLIMAEVIRRASEYSFETQLREEDELGFGVIPLGVKEEIYGSERPLDADDNVKNQFIRSLGLDYSPKLRWYVEGETEYYAIESIVGNIRSIELVNLRGQVIEKKNKGVAFRENLRLDHKMHRFSFISIDGDRLDFVRAVRKSAGKDEFCGMFFVASPDFEFHNFSRNELEQIIADLSEEMGVLDFDVDHLRDVVRDSANAKDLLSTIRTDFPKLSQVGKGSDWGIRLMSYAWEHPYISNGKKRQIIQAVESALRSINADYLASHKKYRVDPTTGTPVARQN